MIAKILINTSVKSLNKVYDYKIPVSLENLAQIGKRVEVNFGNSRKSNEEGIIVKLEEENDTEVRKYKLKEIISFLDDISYVDEKRLKLAKYISYMYFCNVYDALKLLLPPGTASKNSKKSLDGKKTNAIKLVKSVDEIMQDIDNSVITSAKHIQLLTFMIYNDFVLLNDIVDGLGISRAVINTVVKNGYIEIFKVDIEPDFIETLDVKITEPKIPTQEQKIAIEKIGSYIYEEEFKKCLLFGITGSGKTEVYLQTIQKVLNQGKKAIVLVPEISLTYQTVNRFVERFGNNIAILHSKMTISKRKEEYKRIKEGKVDIVIGARSAIFAPLDDIGLVIIDEEHDTSYYSQTTPKYSTKDIATYICKENEAVLLLGSATPEVSSFYKAKIGEMELIELKSRPGSAILPEVITVDMKDEKVLGNSSIFSTKLKEEIIKNIENNEQTMIFLNRRGYSAYLNCNDCGATFKCPNCDVSMTYHKTSNLLLCHYCSHVEKNVKVCYNCNSENISSNNFGTERLEDELQKVAPNISILRLDADTTVSRDSQQKILDEFRNGNINVLIGTQMISKGHDFPNVTLVGILGVDSMLSMNDYTASEKAFSNISQVAGRAGRNTLPGRVIVQTNEPDNYILEAVTKHSYEEFYESEISYRENFSYPPFCDIVLFELVGKNLNVVKAESQRLYDIFCNNKEQIYKVFSPKSPFIQKINNKFRVNILMKTKISKKFYTCIYESLEKFNKDKKTGITLSIVKNPTFI